MNIGVKIINKILAKIIYGIFDKVWLNLETKISITLILIWLVFQ